MSDVHVVHMYWLLHLYVPDSRVHYHERYKCNIFEPLYCRLSGVFSLKIFVTKRREWLNRRDGRIGGRGGKRVTHRYATAANECRYLLIMARGTSGGILVKIGLSSASDRTYVHSVVDIEFASRSLPNFDLADMVCQERQ